MRDGTVIIAAAGILARGLEKGRYYHFSYALWNKAMNQESIYEVTQPRKYKPRAFFEEIYSDVIHTRGLARRKSRHNVFDLIGRH